MVYVASDGRVYQEQPWSVKKVMAIFWGIISMIIAFFQTLIPGFTDDNRNRWNGFGSGGVNRGNRGNNGFGGSNGYGGSGRPPRPPAPGNVRGLGSLPPDPPPSCGSCCGR